MFLSHRKAHCNAMHCSVQFFSVETHSVPCLCVWLEAESIHAGLSVTNNSSAVYDIHGIFYTLHMIYTVDISYALHMIYTIYYIHGILYTQYIIQCTMRIVQHITCSCFESAVYMQVRVFYCTERHGVTCLREQCTCRFECDK